MSSLVRIVLIRKGVQDLLKSGWIDADIKARATRIAAAYGEGATVDSTVGKHRVRASVRVAAEGTDDAERLLTALDAGR